MKVRSAQTTLVETSEITGCRRPTRGVRAARFAAATPKFKRRQNVRFGVRFAMTSMSVTQARSRLYELLDLTAASHEPIQITGKRTNAVLIAEDDWRSIQETLFLLSVPGMRDSIREGLAEPLSQSSNSPGW